MELFVTCSEGLEGLLKEELQTIGYQHVRSGFRGVYVEEADQEAIYRINYCSRLAIRVLLPLLRFKCRDQRSLYQAASTIRWLSYIPKGKNFAIDANVTHRNFRNSLYAAQVAKDAICDQFREKTGSRPNVSPKNPDVQLNLYIRDEQGVISFDTSGIPLHKRGYRQDSVEAPIQETLAAALLKLANLQPNDIVCDPCCGSGTILIEAALMMTNTSPGYLRQHWGFMYLPDYSQALWLKVKGEADKLRVDLPESVLFGCDLNKDAVRIAKTNLRAAGFHQKAAVIQEDFREYTPPIPPNFIICNPPHGIRMENPEYLIPLYRALGDFFKRKSSRPARGFVFTGNLDLAKEIGLAPKRRHVIMNNGVESRFLEFDLF